MAENLINNGNQDIDTVPEKFKDEKGGLNATALLQSYLELEKKLGSMVRIPSDDSSEEEKMTFYKKIGVPDTADAYQLEIKNELLAADPEVNQRLLNLGFTNKQVQTVYDLAAEKVLPVIEDLARDFEASRQRVALENHFGSKDRFDEVARQLTAWSKQNIDTNIFDALATTYEGVMALYKMMGSSEPSMVSGEAANSDLLNEEDLKKLMMSPKYWREQDPATLKKVSDGFNRLYSKKN